MIREKIRQTTRTLRAVSRDLRGQILKHSQPPRYPVVTMYHSISERATQDWGPWEFAVTPETFDRQLSQIDDEYTVVSLDRLTDWMIENKSIPYDSMILTFDDAYRDFRNTALPILERYDFPATVYVPTVLLIEDDAPFEHRLATALTEQEELNVSVDGISINASLRTRSDVLSCYDYVRDKMKFSSAESRERFLRAIDANSISKDSVLDPVELKELEDHPLVTIGAHGHEHVPFTVLSAEEQRANVKTCRDRLTELLGTPPRHFSFPYGSFEKTAVRAVKDAGFDSAVTTQSRPVAARDWGRPYTIPRIDAATSTSVDVFSAGR